MTRDLEFPAFEESTSISAVLVQTKLVVESQRLSRYNNCKISFEYLKRSSTAKTHEEMIMDAVR